MGLTTLEDTIKELAKTRNNAHFMVVDGMSKLMTGKVKECRSSEFDVFGVNWQFRICSEDEDYLSFHLAMKDPQCEYDQIQCYTDLKVVSQSGPDTCRSFNTWFKAEEESWLGSEYFISHEKLKERYIVDDKAVFGAEITYGNTWMRRSYSRYRVNTWAKEMATAERLKLMDVPRNNSRFTWRITRFSSFDGETHSSYEFTVGPRRWKLEVWPTGDSVGFGYMSLFLTATNYVTDSPKGTTLAGYKLRVLDRLNRKHHETYHEELFPNDPADPRKSSKGRSKFLTLKELHKASRGLLVHDQIYISVEFLFIFSYDNL